ncbi:DUF4179 domain-containing protein [Sporosarcina limicola]|uniref:DUF4179 domain-containing protein n=1 Tax=Sporosarcina limicola TaxID=34101 RepID=A0A927R7R6_9BACL|nr:DUF4179 domain-containing protein [Sporosarcina limicola]MBE1556259.1 hypothetical protein [Sporosarcina limicola]
MKGLYKALNEVEVDTTEYNPMELTDLEKKRMKNRMKKKLGRRKQINKIRVGSIAAAVIIMFSIGVGTNTITLAKVPIIGPLLEEYLKINDNQSLEDYKMVIGESVEDNGIQVTLNEVMLDEGKLLISSTFHTNFSDIDLEYNWFSDIEVYINGSKFGHVGGSGGPKNITSSTVNYFWAASLEKNKLEDIQDIKIVFNNLERSGSKKLKKGKWSFEFTASAENLLTERKSIPIDKHFILENGQQIIVDAIVLTPASTTLYYQMLSEEKYVYDYDVHFIVEDVTGKKYDPVSASTSGEKSHIRFGILDEKITKLKITPYLMSGKEGKEKTDYYEVLTDEEFEINLK